MSDSSSQLIKKRIYAFSIDVCIMVLISSAIMSSFFLVFDTLSVLPPNIVDKVSKFKSGIFTEIFMVVFAAYTWSSYYLANGRGPGKILFGIRIDSSQEGVGFDLLSSGIRMMTMFVLFFFAPALLIFPLFQKDKKGLPDLFAKTKVTFDLEQEIAEFLTVNENLVFVESLPEDKLPPVPINNELSELPPLPDEFPEIPEKLKAA